MKAPVQFCETSDGVRIAYSVTGAGPPLVKAANWLSHLEHDAASPVWRHWIDEFSRRRSFIRYDERGCGLSDWDVADFRFEAWVRDLETVVDHLGLEQFPIIGLSQGGPVALAYTALHPERVSHLILVGTYATGWAKRDLGAAAIREQEALIELTELGWGQDTPTYRRLFSTIFMPDASEEQLAAFTELHRQTTSPRNAARFQREFGQIDVSHLLSQIAVPTLVMHAAGETRVPLELGRRLAAGIRNSRFVSLDSRNHLLSGDEPAWPVFVREIYAFVGESLEPLAAGPQSGADPTPATNEAPESWPARIRRHRIIAWSAGYAAFAWILLQVVSVAAEPWNLPAWFARATQGALLLGLVVTIAAAIVLDRYRSR
jgi:pimeloyl-ACP methyl ester carboxylesterase